MLNAMYGHTYCIGNWVVGVCTLSCTNCQTTLRSAHPQTVASAQWFETALWGNPKLELLIIHRGVSRIVESTRVYRLAETLGMVWEWQGCG